MNAIVLSILADNLTPARSKEAYVIKAQQCDAGPIIMGRVNAIRAVRMLVADDVRACRRKFGRAIVQCWDLDMWEVRPMRANRDHAPLWMRYTIHAVNDAARVADARRERKRSAWVGA